MVDVLAKRYGWQLSEIAEKMYWEDVYTQYEYASNMETMERNDSMKFQFMIHAQSKKAIDAWRDMPIPFPARNYKETVTRPTTPEQAKETRRSNENKALSQNFRRKLGVSKMTDAQRKRRDYVAKRQKAQQEKIQELRRTGQL